MRVNTFTLGAVLGLLAVGGTIAARVPYHAFQDVLISEDAVSGLKGTAQSLLHLTRRREEKEEGIAAIRFFVPPSEGDDFEEAWLKLEQDVRDEEKHNDIFDLKKSKLDNLIYYSYGEWEQLRDLHEHFHTDHFQDFAEYVDDHGIAWELRLLTSESRDLDEEQRKGSRRANLERKGGQQPEQPEQPDQDDWEKYVPEEYRPDRDSSSKKKKGRKHKHELSRAVLSTLPADVSDEEAMRVWHELSAKKDLAHVLFHYFVPPGEADKFTDSWLDAAEKTIDEPGNRIFSLRKIATDNTRFYGYGTWDSYGDFMDHFHSRHVERLRGDLDDSDVVYFIQPLIKIGKQKE